MCVHVHVGELLVCQVYYYKKFIIQVAFICSGLIIVIEDMLDITQTCIIPLFHNFIVSAHEMNFPFIHENAMLHQRTCIMILHVGPLPCPCVTGCDQISVMPSLPCRATSLKDIYNR